MICLEDDNKESCTESISKSQDLPNSHKKMQCNSRLSVISKASAFKIWLMKCCRHSSFRAFILSEYQNTLETQN